MWIPAAVSAAASVGSLLSGRQAARQQSRLARNQMQIAGTSFSPINYNGPGGSSITFGGGGSGGTGSAPGGQQVPGLTGRQGVRDLGNGYRRVGRYGLQSDLGSININQGNLGPLRDALVGSAGELYDTDEYSPHYLQDEGAANLFGAGQYFDPQTQGLDAMEPGAGAAYGQTLQGLQGLQGGFQQGLQNQLFGAAGQNFNAANQDFGSQYQNTLGLLRQQAEPYENRALAGLQARLHRTGQAGTTGGGLQTEGLATGFGQADLQRQLSAFGEARNQQNQYMNLGQGFSQEGRGLAGLQDQLAQGAYQRFGLAGDFGRALSAQRYNQTSGAGLNYANLGMNQLSSGAGLARDPYDLQQLQDQLATGRLGAVEGIDGLSQEQLRSALYAMQAQSSARSGQATAGTGMSTGNSFNANALSGLAGTINNNRTGIANFFRGFGGRGGQFGGFGSNAEQAMAAGAS